MEFGRRQERLDFMRKKMSFIRWIAVGLALGACTFSFSLVPGPTSTPVVPTITLTRTITLTATDSPTAMPPTLTPTNSRVPATPVTLDPNAVPKGLIAFDRGTFGEDGLYRTAANALKPGALTFLTRAGYEPVWSPDGKSIAVHVVRFENTPSGSMTWVDDIGVINSDGSGFKQLTQMQNGDRLWEFAWSPDGRWIAVVRCKMEAVSNGIRYSDAAVYVLKSDGSDTMKRIADVRDLESHIEWFPDSEHVGFLDPGSLFTVASISTGERITMGDAQAPDFSHQTFSISANGNNLFYVTYTSTDFTLKKARLEGLRKGETWKETILYTGPLEAIGVFSPMVGDLEASPDGTRLLFVQSEGGKAVLRLFSIGSDAPVTLAELSDCSDAAKTLDPGASYACWSPNWKPGWSSDSQWVMYATAVSGSGWESGDIYLLNTAQVLSGKISPVLQAKGGRFPDWQPVA